MTNIEEQEMTSEEHREKLAKKYGVENNPKLNKLYFIAYEHGHADGYYSVENWFNELVDLIIP